MARIFKKMGDFKPVTVEDVKAEKGAMIKGACSVVDGTLVFTLPLSVTDQMCRFYEEEMTDGQGTKMIPKGGLVVAFDIPEGLELQVTDTETEENMVYRVKRGGMSASRYITLGFDPTRGYKRIAPEAETANA